MDNYAIVLKDVVKSYGEIHILKQLCMKVEKGNIYCLLGSSGCGKTTLLNAIVGRTTVGSGEIWVLGEKLNKRGKTKLDVEIGYMPQETALTREFTVKDAIFYFGRIYQMNETDIEKRYQELSELLDLPPDGKYLNKCSGGQQRRVSFAAALVHKPQLLILDEPTVGIDPVLREKIWSYLMDLVKKEKVTVIITTHYIEECKQADKIGLLRGGRLLADESPRKLLTQFNTESLEEVFLKLSIEQNKGQLPLSYKSFSESSTDLQSSTGSSISISTGQSIPEDYSSEDKLTKNSKPSSDIINKKRMRALLDKNWKQFYRNIISVFFFMLMPPFQTILFIYCLGVDMKDIPVGVVNGENIGVLCSNFPLNETAQPELKEGGCHFKNLGCRFLRNLDAHPMIAEVQYDSLSKAKYDAIHGLVAGVLYVPKNFSSAFENRLYENQDATEETLQFGQLKVWLDMSNYQIAYTLQKQLLLLYVDYQKSLYVDCNYVSKAAEYPVDVEFVYGLKDDSYQVFVIPAAVITMMYFFGSIMTAMILVSEKEEGIWDRSIIAGVTSIELTVSHLLLQGTLAVLVTIELILIVYKIYEFTYAGTMLLMFGIIYLQALCGMSYGFFVSVISVNQTMSINAVMGFFLTILIISGIIWPVEGMSTIMQKIANAAPCTLPIQSLRNVVLKGLPISDWNVAVGMLTSIIWIIIFLSLSLFILKRQR